MTAVRTQVSRRNKCQLGVSDFQSKKAEMKKQREGGVF